MGENPMGVQPPPFMDANRLFVENSTLRTKIGDLQMMLTDTRKAFLGVTSTVAGLLERGDSGSVQRAISLLRGENEIISGEMNRGMEE